MPTHTPESAERGGTGGRGGQWWLRRLSRPAGGVARTRTRRPGVSTAGCLGRAVSMEGVISRECQTTRASRGEGWCDWIACCGRPEETSFSSLYFSVMQTN